VYLTRRVDVLYAEPPSAVRELAMTYRDQSSVRLQWLAPDSDGGRKDLRYRVECVDCAGRGDDDVAYTPRQTDLRGTASVYSPLILVVVWRRVAAFDRPQFFFCRDRSSAPRNESVPIQLAQCWFSGLAISKAEI